MCERCLRLTGRRTMASSASHQTRSHGLQDKPGAPIRVERPWRGEPRGAQLGAMASRLTRLACRSQLTLVVKLMYKQWRQFY